MPEGYSAGTFGANLMAGFLRGLTRKYERRQGEKREDELLAGRREEERVRIGEERKYQRGVLDEERFREGREKKALKTRQDELLDRALFEEKEAATVAHERMLERQALANSFKGLAKPPKEQTDAQRMRDIRTVYAGSLDEDQLRGVMRAVQDYGYKPDAAVGFVLGEDMANEILGVRMKDQFLSYNRAPDEKFIRGDDFLVALTDSGLPGEIPKFNPNKTYSAKELIQLYASSQRDPIQFFGDRDNWLTLMEALFTLLDQNYEPPPPVVGEKPTKELDWFTKLTKTISGAPAKLAEQGVEKLKPQPPKGQRRKRQ